MMGARMGAMYRLKAYFGMVPVEEMDEYPDEPIPARYPGLRRAGRYEDCYDGEDPAPHRYDDGWDGGRGSREPARVAGFERPRDRAVRGVPVDRTAGVTGLGAGAVRGSLAVDPDAVLREPSRIPDRVQHPAQLPEQRDPVPHGAAVLARITTLQPRSYNEARTIGERYRDGVPVIMNLTELDDAAAKRLVDFAAGLAFALRGSIDKVTSRVFLLTPANVEVSADDARRIAERKLFQQD
ncbi:MAG: cell division protein SepF [Pseudonocardia sp.]